MKILIVDDHALIRDALQGVLKKLKRGVVVLEASNSQQALEAIEGHPDVNLVLLDLKSAGPPRSIAAFRIAGVLSRHCNRRAFGHARSSQCSKRARAWSRWLHSQVSAT